MEERPMNEIPFSKKFGNLVPDRKKIIDEIAWKLFLKQTGFIFIRELTDEEKSRITETDQYNYYIEKAEEIYVKKQRALNNKKYPSIEIEPSGVKGWIGGAYCICFVYSKYDGNFVVKGYVREVDEYLKKNCTHYFCNRSLWHLGFNRDIWCFWKKGVHILEPSRTINGRKKFRVWNDEKIRFEFKRMPKRWIPDFDKL